MRPRSLATLKRMARLKVDELRRTIASEERALAALLAEDERLAAKLTTEMAAAEQMSAFVDFAAFASLVKAQREDIQQQAAALEERIAELRARLAKAFAEEKRFAILEERRAAEMKRAQERIEQSILDEVGLRRHAHKGGS
ncbi:MAG: hypothetical protein D6740_05485 [Alphaproteobacteria bacterium]|nr:MAG: hypothetical protein D6740_05485 [Alphaproteobacteria bacterium]